MRRYFKALERVEVVIHTKSDSSIQGFVKSVHADAVVLADARYLDGPNKVEMPDHDAVIPRDSIDWLQRKRSG